MTSYLSQSLPLLVYYFKGMRLVTCLIHLVLSSLSVSNINTKFCLMYNILQNIVYLSVSAYDYCYKISASQLIYYLWKDFVLITTPFRCNFYFYISHNFLSSQKQYARSDTHLEEVVESVCGKMHQYANRLLEDGATQLVRIKGYSDEYNDDLKLDYEKGKSLKYHVSIFVSYVLLLLYLD